MGIRRGGVRNAHRQAALRRGERNRHACGSADERAGLDTNTSSSSTPVASLPGKKSEAASARYRRCLAARDRQRPTRSAAAHEDACGCYRARRTGRDCGGLGLVPIFPKCRGSIEAPDASGCRSRSGRFARRFFGCGNAGRALAGRQPARVCIPNRGYTSGVWINRRSSISTCREPRADAVLFSHRTGSGSRSLPDAN